MDISKINMRNFMLIADALPDNAAESLKRIPKPDVFCGCVVPDNLNSLMLGQLFALQDIKPNNAMTEPAQILFNVSIDRIMKSSVCDVVGLNLWVAHELERIAKLFDSIPATLTSEERQAGADQLKFGLFGIVDNYARRMGITNHDYILQCVSWMTVWQCMKNDAEIMQYDRRLREIYSKKK